MGRQPSIFTEDARIRRLQMRIHHLPGQLRRARKRVVDLENTARSYGMTELLTDPHHAAEAFEREVAAAKAANTERENMTDTRALRRIAAAILRQCDEADAGHLIDTEELRHAVRQLDEQAHQIDEGLAE